jgi:hypothetical protein
MRKEKKTKVFTMRIHPETKMKLESLASNKAFKYNNTAVILHLIDTAFSKTFIKDDK